MIKRYLPHSLCIATVALPVCTTHASDQLVFWRGAHYRSPDSTRPPAWDSLYGPDAPYNIWWVGYDGLGNFTGRDGNTYHISQEVPGTDARRIMANARFNPSSIVRLNNQDLDGDGLFDDSVVGHQFLPSTELNPQDDPGVLFPDRPTYQIFTPSDRFYGGIVMHAYNAPNRNSIQQAFVEPLGGGGHPAFPNKKNHNGPNDDVAINLTRVDNLAIKNPGDDPADLTDDEFTFSSFMLWKKADFLNDGDSKVVSLDADSSFSFESTRWWDNIGEARWIVGDSNGKMYMSQFSVPGAHDEFGHINLLDDPLSVLWAEYDPQGIDIMFDVDDPTHNWLDPVAEGLFQDVQSFGIYLEQDQRMGVLDSPDGGKELMRYSLYDMTFNATVVNAFISGDMNNDGVLTNGDISAFVLALTDPDSYAAAYPGLDPDLIGDFNDDGLLTNGDIASFVDALTASGASSVPEPASLAVMSLAGVLLTRRRRSA